MAAVVQQPTNMRHRLVRVLTPLCVAISIAACGGNSGETPSAAPASVAYSTYDPLVLAIDPPTYPAGGDELLAFKVLNSERDQCGFGLLAQNTRLDAAAKAHNAYLYLNAVWTHSEIPGNPGFTGVDSSARAVAAGYGSDFVSEGIGLGDSGDLSIRGLLSAPYHAINMLRGWKELGLSFAGRTLVTAYGSRDREQASDQVVTYPCAGTSGVVTASTQESPAPFANFNEVWGQPILIRSPPYFELRSARFTGPQGPVVLKVIYDKGNTEDPNSRCQGLWTCIIPEPLQPLTTYEVQLTWLDDGKPGGRTFSFETGSH